MLFPSSLAHAEMSSATGEGEKPGGDAWGKKIMHFLQHWPNLSPVAARPSLPSDALPLVLLGFGVGTPVGGQCVWPLTCFSP